MKHRPLVLVVCALATVCLAAPSARAQSQGVGLTVEAGAQPGSTSSPAASPAPSSAAASPAGATAVPSSTQGDGTTVQGTTTAPGSGTGSGDPLPHTGLDILRLVAVALGLVTLGQVMVRAARRALA